MSTPERHEFKPSTDGYREVDMCGHALSTPLRWCCLPADHEIHRSIERHSWHRCGCDEPADHEVHGGRIEAAAEEAPGPGVGLVGEVEPVGSTFIDSEHHHPCPWCEIDQLRTDLAAMTVKADTYQRQYYAEHGEIAAELDAARGELVTARGERDALRVELAGVTPEGVEWQYRPWIPPAQRTADDWSSMVAVARNRAWAAEAELAAANARIADVLALCDKQDAESRRLGFGPRPFPEAVRDALAGVPAAGDGGTAHG